MHPSIQTRREAGLFISLWVVLAVGAFLRVYHLSYQKLWVDELYMLQISSSSLANLWRQAFNDILPPLASLPFWISANLFGFTEAGIRAVSLIFALIALVLFWQVSRRVLDDEAALMVTWMFAISPLAVYYAQEARPYALGVASAVFTLWAYERLRRADTWRNWVIFAIGACVASQVYMLNVFLVAGQLLALLILSSNRKRVWIGGALTVLAIVVTLGPFLIGANVVMQSWQTRPPINFLSPFFTMANGDLRIASPATRLIASGVLLTGWALALFNRKTWPALLPYLLQIVFFIMAIFIVFPLVGKIVPSYDERAYLMILPASLIGFGLGIQPLIQNRTARLLPAAMLVIFSLASFQSLWRYFDGFVKSPEGELAGMIAAEALPDDCVIVNRDAYSVDAALRYYSALQVYYNYLEDASHWYLVPDYLLMVSPKDESIIELNQIGPCDRYWIVQRTLPVTFTQFLQKTHHTSSEITVEPFRAWLLSK